MKRLFALTLALVATGVFHNAHAQGGRGSDNVLYPQPPLPIYIGPMGGYVHWKNEAAFAVGDNGMKCASFTNGEGNGPYFGIKSFIYITTWLSFSPRFQYEQRSGKFIAPLPSEPARDSRDSIVMLGEEAQVDATMATFSLDLRVAVDIPGTGLYISAGPTGDYFTGGYYNYTERITSPAGFIRSDSRGGEQTLVTKRSFDTYNKFGFDLRGGIGYNLRIGRWGINPEFTYSLPMTSVFNSPDMLKQTGYMGSLAILYNIGE